MVTVVIVAPHSFKKKIVFNLFVLKLYSVIPKLLYITLAEQKHLLIVDHASYSMSIATKRNILLGIIFAGVLGLLVSGYLTYQKYDSSLNSEVCTISNIDGCSVVNTSGYSTILGIPAVIWGMLWFAVLIYLAAKCWKRESWAGELLSWATIGSVFVIYFIVAEIKLGTLCVYCTIVHVLVLVSLVLAVVFFRKTRTY